MSDKYNTGRCKKCKYFSRQEIWCNYHSITGQTRLAQGARLLPDGGCKLFQYENKDDVQSKIKSWNKIPDRVFSKMRPLYDQGLLDTEIAEAVGVSKKSVRRWRIKNNLESNYEKRKRG